MAFQKLLKWTIVDALDEVWSKSGVSPSKKTRQTIIKAAEKISQDIQDDFVRANKEQLLNRERWKDIITLRNHRKVAFSHRSEANEIIEPMTSFNR